MAKIADLANVWDNIRELDLRPIRQTAERPVNLAILGAPGSGRHTLAAQMRSDPGHPAMVTQTPLWISGLELVPEVSEADLVILVWAAHAEHVGQEQELGRALLQAGKKVLVFENTFDSPASPRPPEKDLLLDRWPSSKALRLVTASAADPDSLLRQFVPEVLNLLPDRLLALGRQFPLFRVPIARGLINDTSFANAAYALSTGLAEIVPVFNVPLNVTDMIVLTKAQAFLVYKLGLALGLSTRWQDYVAEFSSVIGGGFMWRQMARFLVGLIPVWGIVPKVAVAYSGTYVVGNAVLQWYLTGRHLSPKQMRQLSAQAFARGKSLARSLIVRAPRPRLGRRKKKEPELLPSTTHVECPQCGKASAPDAAYCQYCGQRFGTLNPPQETPGSLEAGEKQE